MNAHALSETASATLVDLPTDGLLALPQELLWSIWRRCHLSDLVRARGVSTALRTSAGCFVAKGRFDADDGITLGSGKAVVGLLTWWLDMACSTQGAPDALVVECFDGAQQGTVKAWALRSGCTAEPVAYRHFTTQYAHACRCGHESRISSFKWARWHFYGGHAHQEIRCRNCRSVWYPVHAPK
jgi:hypothetical protein